jgi:hypothetical protein
MDKAISTSAPAWMLHWAFWFINTSSSILRTLYGYIERVKSAANFMYSDQEYMFVRDSVFPYDLRTYKSQEGISSSLIYNVNKRVFYSGAAALTKKTSSLPILSLEIINKTDTVLYDITDFIESVRSVSSLSETLCIGHIISVWQLSSGTILDNNEVSVRYINMNGDTNTVDIRSLVKF